MLGSCNIKYTSYHFKYQNTLQTKKPSVKTNGFLNKYRVLPVIPKEKHIDVIAPNTLKH